MTASPLVSLCIPAYRAESFIARTLRCALDQTHASVEVCVSIDGRHDRTEEICRAAATRDQRVRVEVQDGGLGWAANTTAALRMASADLVSVYFHDDIIEPTYVEELAAALASRPDAASAHCDLVEFGLRDDLRPAHPYDGSTLHRVVDYVTTRRGTTLRSLIRRDRMEPDLRFPSIHGDNHWSAFVFHIALAAAGPALAVNRPLYRRWQREGSLTRSEGWLPPSIDDLLRGEDESRTLTFELLDRRLDGDDRGAARAAIALFHRLHVRQMQGGLGSDEPIGDRLPYEIGMFDGYSMPMATRQLLEAAEARLVQLDPELRG